MAQGRNGDSALEGAPSTPECKLSPSIRGLTASSKEREFLRGRGSSSDSSTLEQMLRDTSSISMKYGKRVPEKEAGGKEKM